MTPEKTRAAGTRRIYLTLLLSAIVLVGIAASASAATTTFTFSGGGWGHGIGMSQYGALGYAQQGQTYPWILNHYFSGTTLETKPAVTVRVNLDKSNAARSQWQIQAGADTTLTVSQVTDPTKKATLDATGRYWITTSSLDTRLHQDETYVVTDPDGTKTTLHRPGTIIMTFDGACKASAGWLMRIVDPSGPYGRSSSRWRGEIHFVPATSSTSKAINYVPIESYLYGVVPCEVSASWPVEALRAQAVAARSYAYQDGVDGKVLWCTTMSQMYGGYASEAAATTQAVKDTAGQVVWYGSETTPVKTFFFSSSGGHTADIEDVWTSSSPKPYYTGVADADQSSPHYRWVSGPWTTDIVSGKVRDRDNGSDNKDPLDYSAPAPHVITRIVLEHAESGHAHHATLKWSNGQSFRISGDTLRSALALRSTKFTTSIGNPAPEIASHEETSTELFWHGQWWTGSSPVLSTGAMRHTAVYGSKVTATFEGTGIKWIGNRAPSYGKASVYVDGRLVSVCDLYSKTRAYQQTIFSRQGLAAGRHTLVIRVLGTKNAYSSSATVAVDRFDVSDGTLVQSEPYVARYEESSPLVAWLGDWTTFSKDGLSGGTHIASSAASSTVSLRFVGSGITWVGYQTANYGTARVTLDGVSEDVALASASPHLQQALWSKQDLDMSKVHVLVIEALGPDADGSSGYISVDRLDVTGGSALATQPLPQRRVEDTASEVEYSEEWLTNANPSLSAGTHHASATAGATATLSFEGTGVRLVGLKAPSYGIAEVWLDGAKVATIDAYSAARVFQAELFARAGLACRPHTLQVKILGQKRAASTGTWVSVDAFVVE